MIEISVIKLVIGFVITLVSGGAAGALINRYFQISDRKKNEQKELTPEKITIEKVKDEQLFIPVGDGKHFVSMAHKEFVLVNTSKKDIPTCQLIFEFDKYSVIGKCNVVTPKGVYQCELREHQPTKYVFDIKEFNRQNSITFKFEQSVTYDQNGERVDQNGFINFYDVFLLGCTGIELEKKLDTTKKLPTINVTEK